MMTNEFRTYIFDDGKKKLSITVVGYLKPWEISSYEERYGSLESVKFRGKTVMVDKSI